MDHDGYGHSGSSGNNSDIMSGVEDLKAAMPVIQKETGQQQDAHVRHVVGRHPRGGLCAGEARSSVDRLVALGLHLQGQRRRRKSRGAARGPRSCAPTRGASATPR